MGKKSWKKGWLIIVLVMAGLIWEGSAFGFVLLDGKLSVSGFLRNDFGVRMQDGARDVHPGWDAGDISLFRNTFQVEGTYELTEMLNLTAIYRGWYDASMDFDSDIEDRIAPHARDDFRKDNDLRELYVDVFTGCWQLRFGKQQIVWGESDGFRMADVINPLDYSWHYFYPSWEDIRFPLWALRAIGSFGEKFSAEFVFIPSAFDDGFVTTGFPPAGANWNFAGFSQFFIDAVQKSKPEKDLRSAEYGMRIKYNLQWIDVGMFAFYSRSDGPVYEEDFVPRLLAGNDELFQFPYTMKIGGTFNYQMQKEIPGFQAPVIRGECVYTVDEPFNPRGTAVGALPGLMTRVFERDTFAYMIGYDANFFNYTLNPSGTSFYHSVQVFQKYIINHNDLIDSPEMVNDDFQTLITFYMNTQYINGKLTPHIFTMYNPTGAWWFQTQVAYQHRRAWNSGIGYQLHWAASQRESYFGFVRDNDEIYGWVRFSW